MIENMYLFSIRFPIFLILLPLRHSIKSIAIVFILMMTPSLWAQPIFSKNNENQPPFVILKSSSIKTGNKINRDNYTNFDYSYQSKTTIRSLAVEVQTRVFKDFKAPLEIQCFFIAKDNNRTRYIFDAFLTQTMDKVGLFSFYSRDLFGGHESRELIDIPIHDYQTNTSSSGILARTNMHPGSKIEGWIIRLVYKGVPFKIQASVSELEAFAKREQALLDEAIANVPSDNKEVLK